MYGIASFNTIFLTPSHYFKNPSQHLKIYSPSTFCRGCFQKYLNMHHMNEKSFHVPYLSNAGEVHSVHDLHPCVGVDLHHSAGHLLPAVPGCLCVVQCMAECMDWGQYSEQCHHSTQQLNLHQYQRYVPWSLWWTRRNTRYHQFRISFIIILNTIGMSWKIYNVL